jgi:prolyl 4-hydroxylase
MSLILSYSKAREYQREHEEASLNVGDFLTNPINAFLLTKRLTSDWKQVEAIMTHDVGEDFVRNISEYRGVLKFPSDEDLNGAAIALIRLQDTYNLDTSSISSGILNGVQYSTGLTAGDCFELGRQTYVNGDYFHTVLWMKEAMDLIRTETNTTTTKENILEYLAFSTYKQGRAAYYRFAVVQFH